MNDFNSASITRRYFNKAACAATILMGSSFSVFSSDFSADIKKPSADGVIQLKADGKIYIHSGGGHGGPYAMDNAIVVVEQVMEQAVRDVYVMMGGNPRQLPVFLGQHLNHLSFSTAKTNRHAAETLKTLLEKKPQMRKNEAFFMVEDGISEMTRAYIQKLDPEGIVVAVRQVS